MSLIRFVWRGALLTLVMPAVTVALGQVTVRQHSEPHVISDVTPHRIRAFVQVVDSAGIPVPDVNPDAFQVMYGGKPAEVTQRAPDFVNREAPLGIILVLDVLPTTRENWDTMWAFARGISSNSDLQGKLKGCVLLNNSRSPGALANQSDSDGRSGFANQPAARMADTPFTNQVSSGRRRLRSDNLDHEILHRILDATEVGAPANTPVAIVVVLTGRHPSPSPEDLKKLKDSSRPVYVLDLSSRGQDPTFTQAIGETGGLLFAYTPNPARKVYDRLARKLATVWDIGFVAPDAESRAIPKFTVGYQGARAWMFPGPATPYLWWYMGGTAFLLVLASALVTRKGVVAEYKRRRTTKHQLPGSKGDDTGDHKVAEANDSPAGVRKTKKQTIVAMASPDLLSTPKTADPETGFSLEVVSGPAAGKAVYLTKGDLIIGDVRRMAERPAQALDLSGDAYVSAAHARVEWMPDALEGAPAHILTHMSATNPTLLNGNPIKSQAMLRDGFMLKMGESEILVRGPEKVAS